MGSPEFWTVIAAPAQREGGPSNSHLGSTSGPPSAIAAGIDTWRLARYLDDSELDVALRRCTRPSSRGYLFPDSVAGHRIGVLPGHRMLWLEGHPVVEGLAPPTSLHAAETQLLDQLTDLGVPTGRDAGVARLDQTVTLEFDEPDAGLAFLSGVASVDVRRLDKAVYYSGSMPETVYLRFPGSSRLLARVYDEGVKHGTANRGQLVASKIRLATRRTLECLLALS